MRSRSWSKLWTRAVSTLIQTTLEVILWHIDNTSRGVLFLYFIYCYKAIIIFYWLIDWYTQITASFFPPCSLAGKTERSSYTYGRESNPHCHQVSWYYLLFSSAMHPDTFLCRVVAKSIYLQYMQTRAANYWTLKHSQSHSSRARRTEHRTSGFNSCSPAVNTCVKQCLQMKSAVFCWTI